MLVRALPAIFKIAGEGENSELGIQEWKDLLPRNQCRDEIPDQRTGYLHNLIEYRSLGHNPTTPNSSNLIPGIAKVGDSPELTLTCLRARRLDEASFNVEASANLAIS